MCEAAWAASHGKDTYLAAQFRRFKRRFGTKGETSGNRLLLTYAATDCDNDTVLCKVRVDGDGLVCHEGTRSCFTKPMTIATSSEVSDV